ncbi:MAG: ATP-binding protein [Bryobacteraceae bacterium]|nr:ATP-binding protein [Bryobacteraceae bacterium]
MPAPKRNANLTARIFLKLILGVFCVLVVALTAVDFLASRVAEKTYLTKLSRELEEKNRMLALADVVRLGEQNSDRFHALAKAAGGRLTVIAHDGHVIGDSEADAARMENHATRPEVVQALHGSAGKDIRLSHTMGLKFLYVASPVAEGCIRLAVPLKEIDTQVSEIRNQLLASVAVAFLPAIIVAGFFARYVSSKLAAIIQYAGRLARGEFAARLPARGRDELGILVEQLNDTGEKLQEMFDQLQREHAELEKVERVRKDFVINVSHELRTPLASIQGYTETLLEGALYDPEHNVRFLSIIRQNAERLGRLTGDLMTLSRLELKTTRFQFASYYVNSLLLDCADSMRPMSEKKHIDLTVEQMPDRTEIFCDSEAVHQVMSNLLDNALKYTPQGGRVTVAARKLDGNPEMIEIAVLDTGLGVPAEDLPRLFERFYRVDKARSREMGGTGLGLAIVKHLVRSQGGTVYVESEVGQGSKFMFTLPVHDLGLQEYGAVQEELTGAMHPRV